MTGSLPAIPMVDDNPGNLYLLEAMLEHTGIALVRAGSGAEALGQVLQRGFALIQPRVVPSDGGLCGFEAAVLAEGVETADQVAFLRAHAAGDDGAGGCEIQGFLLSHPLPGEERTRLLGEGRRPN